MNKNQTKLACAGPSARAEPQYKRPIGSYVPPAKRVKQEKFEVGSQDHQRLAWDENKRKITGLINRVSSTNVKEIIKELFQCNLIRYKGLFATALLKANVSSGQYNRVYAALLSVITSRIKTVGALVVNRLILQYRIYFLNDDKRKCLASLELLAHLANQEVIHEALAFQIIDHLLGKPTIYSIELVILFIQTCGAKLDQLNPVYLFEVFRNLRDMSLENEFDDRTHALIDALHQYKKDKFPNNPPIDEELDLVDESDRVTLTITLDGPTKSDYMMESNYFKYDPNWAETEAKYKEIRQALFDQDASSDDSGSEEADEGEGKDDGECGQEDKKEVEDKKDVKPEVPQKVIDATGRDLIEFRRNVYLTIKSSISHEEVVHKLIRLRIIGDYHEEFCQMILDCCGQERTYETIYGLIASKLCQIQRHYAPEFEKIFASFYAIIHRFETNKIRNIAKFYAHLLTTESIDWACLKCLELRENATSSAGRCFIKFLFQELVSILSLPTLVEYTKNPARESAFTELFPTDQEQDTRFAINFFTFCGLGELTEGLRKKEFH